MSEEKEIDESLEGGAALPTSDSAEIPAPDSAEPPTLDNAETSVSTSPEGMSLEELQNQTHDAVADGANDSVGECEIPASFLEEAKELFGEEGGRMLVEGIRIYREYQRERLRTNTAVRLEACARCNKLEEGIMNGFIKKLGENYISKRGLLKTDPLEILGIYNLFLGRVNRDIFKYPDATAEGVFIDGLHEQIFRHLVALVVKDENVYREKFQEEKKTREGIAMKVRRLVEVGELMADRSKPFLEWAMLDKQKKDLAAELVGSSWVEVGQKNGKTRIDLKRRRPFGLHFFGIVDDSGKRRKELEARMEQGGVPNKELGLKEALFLVFDLLKTSWLPLLNDLEMRGVRNISVEAMKTENDRIFAIWKEEELREVATCTAQNKTLSEDPMVMQISPMEHHQGIMFARNCVQVDYYDEKTGAIIKNDRQAQEMARPRIIKNQKGDKFVAVKSESPFPAIFLNRNSGEIEGAGIHTETIKLLAKNPASYEALRKDILYYLAHLTCSATTLKRMYGEDHFTKKPASDSREKKKSKHPKKKNKTRTGTTATRVYPYESDEKKPTHPAEIVFQVLEGETATYITGEGKEMESEKIMTPQQVRAAIENLEKHMTAAEVVSHRMLLPLMQRAGGEEAGEVDFVAKKAREKARRLAKAYGRILRRGIEFTSLVEGITEEGCVFPPKRLNELMDKCGAKTLEEIVEMFPGIAYIREETWVVPGGEEKKDAILHGYESTRGRNPEAVSSGVKKAVRAVVPPRKNS